MLRVPRFASASALCLAIAIVALPVGSASLVKTTVLLPDLFMGSIQDYTDTTSDGDVLVTYLELSVGNIGPVSSDATTLLLTFRDPASQTAEDATGATAPSAVLWSVLVPVPSLPAHSLQTLRVDASHYADGSPVPGGLGYYHVTSTLDPDDDVAELDEGNNERSGTGFAGYVDAP